MDRASLKDPDFYTPVQTFETTPLFSPWLGYGEFGRLQKLSGSGTPPGRLYYIYELLTQALKLHGKRGEVWECGVYRGDSAVFLGAAAAATGARLRLFDTFAGMPEGRPDKDFHAAGDFADTSVDFVKNRFSILSDFDIQFHVGTIPETFAGLDDVQISFVHIDLDIFESYLSTLKFVFPRLLPGASLVFDDYAWPTCPGAREAVDMFFSSYPEQVIVLPTGQAYVTKVSGYIGKRDAALRDADAAPKTPGDASPERATVLSAIQTEEERNESRSSRPDPERPVGWEPRKSYASKIANGFFDRYLSGSAILDIGYKGYDDGFVPILPHAIGVDLDYPGYDGITLPFPDESQDAIYTSHCLEHISDYKRAIHEWFRVVKRGGHLVIVVPHQYLYERRREVPSRWNPDHKRFYTPASLLREIEEVLEPNSYRIRHLIDNDFGFDYSLLPRQNSVGCQEIELVLEKIQQPAWTLDGDLYSAADFFSRLPLERPHPFALETDFAVSDDCVVYGPYVQLSTGDHDVTFHIKAIGLGDQELASPITFDVAKDTGRIASVALAGLQGSEALRNGKVVLRFQNTEPESVFEFRIYASGRPFQGTFAFYGVSLRHHEPPELSPSA
jgi:SAM-dependent methyltransferase